MTVTPDVAEALAGQKSIETVKFLASKYGYEPLQVDAMRRVIEGATSLDEARRQVLFAPVECETPVLRLAA